jgi:hypothetical protein
MKGQDHANDENGRGRNWAGGQWTDGILTGYTRRMLKVASTPDGLVVRDIQPGGESAYRLDCDGGFSRCLDHKAPWVAMRPDQVPGEVLRLLKPMPPA